MKQTIPKIKLRQRGLLFWGKIRRFYYYRFRPSYIERNLKRRRGECDRTGACCKLGYYCFMFDESNGGPECKIYSWRHKNCWVFPIDERDLRDRDIVLPDRPCGYYFIPEFQLEQLC